ncbi:hypothetical protein CNMCM5793_005147 [Aspergillus hiratsukae]|uniref:Uncharacterized protein n=1 Tax=Aspergillus hiratsukae TaxID=1194566 RepID=A0A8H6P3D2_9EURO|nr:hypothetical protein CNMCM5793_005147 [Aspergillus hiratsukae]KAF7161394.1 hypothetical protein CNMCM6106_008632 [Aspergillus hiratsukae]
MDVMSTDQHRMINKLCDMVNGVFYNSQLSTAIYQLARWQKDGPPRGERGPRRARRSEESHGAAEYRAKNIEAPIGSPVFEWAGTKTQLSLPQAIIEELSDLSSDSGHEHAEKLEDAQTTPATTVEPAATPSTSATATVLGEASTHTAIIETSARGAL